MWSIRDFAREINRNHNFHILSCEAAYHLTVTRVPNVERHRYANKAIPSECASPTAKHD